MTESWWIASSFPSKACLLRCFMKVTSSSTYLHARVIRYFRTSSLNSRLEIDSLSIALLSGEDRHADIVFFLLGGSVYKEWD